jgi:hypothetical protein
VNVTLSEMPPDRSDQVQNGKPGEGPAPRFPWWASLGFAKESFDIGGADTVVPAWQPYGFEFSVADPSVYGADGNMQDARDLSDSQQIFVA